MVRDRPALPIFENPVEFSRRGFSLTAIAGPVERVPNAALGGLDGDTPARGIIEAQERDIAQRSGVPRSPIKVRKRASLPRGDKIRASLVQLRLALPIEPRLRKEPG